MDTMKLESKQYLAWGSFINDVTQVEGGANYVLDAMYEGLSKIVI